MKRALGRPRRRWGILLKYILFTEWEGVDWTHPVQNRVQWQAFVSTVTNLRVSQKAGHFLNSWAATVCLIEFGICVVILSIRLQYVTLQTVIYPHVGLLNHLINKYWCYLNTKTSFTPTKEYELSFPILNFLPFLNLWIKELVERMFKNRCYPQRNMRINYKDPMVNAV